MIKVKSNLWLFSDSHFGHDNIMKFQQRPKNHESMMLSNWIERVREDDYILHMGDVCMSKGTEVAQRWLRIIGRMPGQKKLILGNHDKEAGPVYKAYKNLAGFEIIPEFIQNRVAFTHRPITSFHPAFDNDLWDINVHGHTHGNPIYPDIDGGADEAKTYINVCVEMTNYAPITGGS